MREKFKNIPIALRRIIIERMFIGIAAIIGVVLILIFLEDVALIIPFMGIAVISLVSGIFMLRNCLSGRYVVLSGVCVDIGYTVMRKKVSYVCIKAEDIRIKIFIRIRRNKVNVGDTVTIYIPHNAKVYEHNGGKTVCDYYALDITK